MPYIPKEQRQVIDKAIDGLAEAIKKATVKRGTASRTVKPDGAMNYSITKLVLKLLLPAKPSYIKIERAVGLMGCVSLEVYRKLGAVYEDLKAQEDGEVFES